MLCDSINVTDKVHEDIANLSYAEEDGSGDEWVPEQTEVNGSTNIRSTGGSRLPFCGWMSL